MDAARHADGLISIQARDQKGGITHEVQSYLKAPQRLRIEKHGNSFFMFAGQGENLDMAGGGMQLALEEPFYVGLGVCAHDKDSTEKIAFSNVEITSDIRSAAQRPVPYSTIEVVRLAAPTDHRAAFVAAERLESPTWSRDGQTIFFNRNHRLERVPAAGGKAEALDIGGAAVRSVGGKGVSPDGALLAFSDDSRQRGRPAIFVAPVAGGAPRRITANTPAVFHGWSPDGQTIVFSAERAGQADIYTIPAAGGAEKRLTNGQGRNEIPNTPPTAPRSISTPTAGDPPRSGACAPMEATPSSSLPATSTTGSLTPRRMASFCCLSPTTRT